LQPESRDTKVRHIAWDVTTRGRQTGQTVFTLSFNVKRVMAPIVDVPKTERQ